MTCFVKVFDTLLIVLCEERTAGGSGYRDASAQVVGDIDWLSLLELGARPSD